MFETITTAAILYIATAVDLLVILLIFFARANNYQQYKRYLYWTISRVINFNFCKFVLLMYLTMYQINGF